MKVSKVGILLMVAAVVLVLGAFRPGMEPDRAEASLAGIFGLPSAVPGVLPAIAPASAPGNLAVVNVTCLDPITGACPLTLATLTDALTFTLTRVFPDGAPAASFAASGGATLVCSENSPCDLELGVYDGNVAVQVNGGGQNEVVNVEACDQTGDCRNQRIIFVETILAVSPLHAAASYETTLVSYACPLRGPVQLEGQWVCSVAPPATCPPNIMVWVWNVDANDIDGRADLEHTAAAIVPLFVLGGILAPTASLVLPEDFGPMWRCGATAPTQANRVTFETDAGILSVQAVGNPITISGACDSGDSVDVNDYPFDPLGLLGFPSVFPTNDGAQCDLDAFSGPVVTYGLEGTGDVGVATVDAQQLGGGGPLRTINVTFAGAPALSLFLDAPSIIGVTGGDFTVTVVDQNGVPVGNETVECTVEPTGGAIAVIPQTGTTGDIAGDEPGSVTMSLTPTGLAVMAGQELTLTCVLDSNPDVSASATINLSMTPELEVVDLVAGCNPVSSTWDDGTAASDVAAAVAPADALDAIWAFDTAAGTWLGYAPDAPAGVSDLETVDRLDAIFICVDADATVSRPVI